MPSAPFIAYEQVAAPAVTRLYLVDVTAAGYVATEKSAALPGGTGVNSGFTLKTLSSAKRAVATNDSFSGAAQTAHQDVFLRKFVTDFTLQRDVPAGNWTVGIAAAEGNVDANAFLALSIYVLTVGDTVRGYAYDSDTALGSEWATGEGGNVVTVAGSAVTGTLTTDRLCLEVWAHTASQTAATAYTRTIYHSGGILPEQGVAITSAASYLDTPADLTIAAAAAVSAPLPARYSARWNPLLRR